MSLNRRQLLMFFGATAGTVALGTWPNSSGRGLGTQIASAAAGLAFKPVKVPMPLATMGLTANQQAAEFAEFARHQGRRMADPEAARKMEQLREDALRTGGAL